MSRRPLTPRFLLHLPTRARAPSLPDRLEAGLTRILDAARTAFPSWRLDEDAFLAHLGARVQGESDLAEALEGVHAEDLFLAFASLAGHGEALQELDRRVVTATRSAVAQFRAAPSFAEDVQQLVRQKLLLSTGTAPAKLLDYAGRGPLALWLRIAALRVALNLIDAEKPRAHGEPAALKGLAAPEPGPESVLEQRRVGPALKGALEEALQQLSTRERNYLRLYFVEGLTVEAIARMEGAHKSTVSRWLSRSKETLLMRMRALLAERLALSPPELESLMGDLHSQLDLSLLRVLG